MRAARRRPGRRREGATTGGGPRSARRRGGSAEPGTGYRWPTFERPEKPKSAVRRPSEAIHKRNFTGRIVRRRLGIRDIRQRADAENRATRAGVATHGFGSVCIFLEPLETRAQRRARDRESVLTGQGCLRYVFQPALDIGLVCASSV